VSSENAEKMDFIKKDIRTKNKEQRQDVVYQYFTKFKVLVINDVHYSFRIYLYNLRLFKNTSNP